jgi:hypothetical protein
MRRNLGFLSVGIAAILAAGVVTPAVAEDTAAGPSIRPAEIYGCTYREGKGMADLKAATANWNAWMDKTGQNDYWAFLLIPYYHSSEFPFDVLWAGGWQSGATMANGLKRWVTEGGEAAAEFDKVVQCKGVTNFAVMDLSKAPAPPDSGPVSFSDCTLTKGRKFADALAAVQAWITYEKENGIADDNYLLFPAFGESTDAKYTFKWVTTSDWPNLGKSYDQYGNGGGYQKAEELFGGLLECDSSRLYVSQRVRKMQMKK